MKKRIRTAAVGVLLLGTVGFGIAEVQAIVKPRGLSVLDSYVPSIRSTPFPPRPAGALGGRAILEKMASLSQSRREAFLVAEILSGNVPDHLRTFVPVRMSAQDALGRPVTATAWVLPDYLAVGSSDDFVRVPLSGESAGKIAVHFGLALPTTKMVNEIYNAADIKLAPIPLPPTAAMTSPAYALKHNDEIETAMLPILNGITREARLVAGHKKDLVMTKRLETHSQQLAIYGWHRPNGKPIQPLSTVHGRRYADYSHGIRLVSNMVFVDGRDVAIEDALSDRSTAGLFSTEGRFSTYALVLETSAYGLPRAKGLLAALTNP